MRQYKDLLNELTRKDGMILKPLGERESKALKMLLMEMFRDFAALCEAHGITYMLGGGSCLGAVRHQGFIPWDDDMDINVPRQDYERLKLLLMEGAMGEKYDFACPNSGKDVPCCFMKIYRKGTRLVELGSEMSEYPKMVFVDVFPMDGVSKNPVVRRTKGWAANAMRLIANMVSEANSPMTDQQRRFYRQDRLVFAHIMTRRVLGRLFSVVPHQKWVDTFDAFVRQDVQEHGVVAFPAGRMLYNGEVMPVGVHLPVGKGMFEGMEVCLPNDTDRYLSNLYGKDFLTLPDDENRDRHLFVDFEVAE